MAYLGSKVTFQCHAAEANSSLPVNYWLLKSGKPLATITHPQGYRPAMFVIKITVANEGSYSCTVTSEGNTTRSNSITLRLRRRYPPIYRERGRERER